MTTTIQSALCKFIHRLQTDAGAVNIFEYKVQIADARILIHAPWRIDNLKAWLLEVEALTASSLADYPVGFRNIGFVEEVVNRYGDVWERRARFNDNYSYIFYAVVGELNNSLRLMRAFVGADRDRFYDHIRRMEETPSKLDLDDNLLETQEIDLGRTIASYRNLDHLQ